MNMYCLTLHNTMPTTYTKKGKVKTVGGPVGTDLKDCRQHIQTKKEKVNNRGGHVSTE